MGLIVTTEQAVKHLRLFDLEVGASPPDIRESDVELKIVQAEAIIVNYLKVDPDDVLEGSPPAWQTGSPPLWTARQFSVIQAAVLLMLSALYDDDPERTVERYMKLNVGAVPVLLMRLRDPALA